MRPLEKLERIPIVIVHHVAPIALHGVRTRSLVEDGFGFRSLAGTHSGNKVDFVEIVANRACCQIDELIRAREIVHGDDVRNSRSI